ncbi:acyl-CoA dehydrogenase, partial [Streptomyces sp. ND04-05B]|nr:acyl-CoA dehydrogenase [Streptomyces sp. ND04-05B]
MLSDPAVQGLHGKAAPTGTAAATDPATHQARESAVRARIANLENRFGDPQDPANPLGAAGLLAADEAGELPAAGERLLADVVLKAELLPTNL